MSTVLPLWFEIGSMVLLVSILIVDLLLIIKRPHVPSMREASLWVGFYVLLALVFAGALFLLGDVQHGSEFLAGWLTEYSLSIDNLFVFVLILASFKVPKAYQQRALMVGIVLALIFRGLFILAGAALIERFIWIFFIFGAWLIWTAWQQIRHDEDAEQMGIRDRIRVLASVHLVSRRAQGRAFEGLDALQIPERQGPVRVLSPRLIEAAHLAGVEVHVWTVNDPARMKQLIDLGVDGIITDRADLALDALR